MKFSISQFELMKSLNIVSKGVSQKTTMPILKGILMETTEDNKLKLTSSDLEFCIETVIECSVEIKGKTVVPAKLFFDVIRKLNNEEIFFNLGEDRILNVKSLNFSFNIVTLDKEDFPNIGNVEGVFSNICIKKEKLMELFKKTEFIPVTNIEKPVFSSILFNIEKDNISLVSTDGSRIAVSKEEVKNMNENKFLIYYTIVKEINKIICEIEDYDSVNIIIGENKVVFIVKETKIITRIMEGNFLNYKDYIPKEFLTNIVINREEMINSLERADLISRSINNNLIRLEIKENLMIIKSSSEEAEIKEEIILEKEGENIEIGYNCKFFIEILKRINEEFIKIYFNKNINPCLIKSIEEENYEYVVLPVRLS